MKQTLVIGSAVTDVIINIDHLPHTGEDIHISSQSRSLAAVPASFRIFCAIPARRTASVPQSAAGYTAAL